MRDRRLVRSMAGVLLSLSVGACAVDTDTSSAEPNVGTVVAAATCAEPDVDVFHVKAVVMGDRWLSYFDVPHDHRRALDYTIDVLRGASHAVGAWTCELLPGPGGWYCDNGQEYWQCVHYETGPSCDHGKVDPDTNPSGCGA